MKNPKKIQSTITVLGVGTAISLLGDSTLYTVLPHPAIASQVGVTLAMVGILLGANRAIRILLNGPIGVLYDKLPRRGVLVGSLTLGAISSVFYAAGYGFWPLLIGRVMWGIAWSGLWIGGNAMVLDISDAGNRGRISGQYQMWFSIGVASASFLGGFLTDALGFRSGQWLCAALIGAAALGWYFALPETRPKDHPHAKTSPVTTHRRLPWRVVWPAGLTLFVARFISWGIVASTSILWLSNLVGEGLNFGRVLIPIATLNGTYTALSMLTSISSAPASGFLSDRLGKRWPVIAFAMLIGGVGIGLMGTTGMLVAVLGAFLVPIVGGSAETLIPAIAGDRVEDSMRGRTLGAIYAIADIGSTLGPPVALGILNAAWLPLSGIYQISALILGLMALVALMQKRQND